jgi:hypothetical protein
MNSTSDFYRPSISFVSEMLRFTNRNFKQRHPAADLKLFLHFSFNLFYFRPRGHFLMARRLDLEGKVFQALESRGVYVYALG